LSEAPTATLARRPLTLVLVMPLVDRDGSVPLCGELVELLPALREALRLRDEAVRWSIVVAYAQFLATIMLSPEKETNIEVLVADAVEFTAWKKNVLIRN